MWPTLSALEEETQNIPRRDSGTVYAISLGQRRNIKPSLKNKICHLVQYGGTDKAQEERSNGVLVTPKHRTTRATVCELRAHVYGIR